MMLYHNPRCSKSREALNLLRQQGIEPTIIEYLKTPLDRAELEALLLALQKSPRELLRRQEPVYKTLNLADPTLDEGQILNALIEHPILMERPIVVDGGRALIAHPPEALIDFLR